jgi:lipoteichoic acid synthase
LLYEQNKSILLKFFAIILSIIYILQMYSIYIAGGLLSPLAIINAQTATTTTITFTGLYVLLMLLIFVLILRHSGYLPTFFKLNINKYVIGLLGLLVIAPYPFTTTPDNINIQYMDSPVRSFMKTISHVAFGTDIQIEINPSVLAEIRKSHFYKNQNNHLRIENKNILVIFSEGFSTRWIYEYSGKYPELTPNLNSFYKRSYVIDNYYNHTAATFRGLRGQIFSLFQKTGGFYANKTGLGQKDNLKLKFDFNTPIQALKRNGYKNYFFLSQENKLNGMLKTMQLIKYTVAMLSQKASKKKRGDRVQILVMRNFLTAY